MYFLSRQPQSESVLLKNSNFITIHAPLTNETRNILDKNAFSKMKKGVSIINASRGGIINEKDLFEALENNIVNSAAIDVFENEPPEENHPLVNHEKVIVTPHLGASTKEAQIKVAIQIAEQTKNFFVDNEISNTINHKQLSLL